jgi:hypothetical protein
MINHEMILCVVWWHTTLTMSPNMRPELILPMFFPVSPFLYGYVTTGYEVYYMRICLYPPNPAAIIMAIRLIAVKTLKQLL